MKRLITLIPLLAFSVSLVCAANCSNGRPSVTYIYVNGLWAKSDILASAGSAQDDLAKLSANFHTYVTNALSLGNAQLDCVAFKLAYVNASGPFNGLLKLVGMMSSAKADQYANSPDGLINEDDKTKSGLYLSLLRYKYSLDADLNSYAGSQLSQYTQAQKDLNNLLTIIKQELAASNKVVLLGHDLGNLFANVAYDQMVKNEGIWQTQNGIRLPDTTKLVAIGVADPSDHVADRTEMPGRLTHANLRDDFQRYTTACQDFVWTFIPGALGYNTNGFVPSCEYSKLINAGLQLTNVKDLVNKLTTLDPGFTGQNSSLNLNTVLGYVDVFNRLKDLAIKMLVEFGLPYRYHKFTSYLDLGTDSGQQVMNDLVAALPQLPFQTAADPCLYCESFTNTDVLWPMHWETVSSDIPGLSGNAGVIYGALSVQTPRFTKMPLQTSQQFFGRFSAQVEFTYQGNGISRIALVRGSKSAIVAEMILDYVPGNLTLSIYSSAGAAPVQQKTINTYLNSRNILTTEVDGSEVRMYLNNQLMLRAPWTNDTQSTSSQGGLYLQVSSDSYAQTGNTQANTLLIHNVAVNRLAFIGPIQAPSPTLSSVDTSALVGGSLTPVSAVGTKFDSGVTLQFSNSGACANYTCVIPSGDISSRTATIFVAKTNLASGAYSVRAKNSDGQVSNVLTITVKAPAPTMTLTPTTNPVSIVQGEWGYVDLTLKSVSGLTGNPTLTLYCSVSCPAGFNYYRPDGVSTTPLPANGSLPIRVNFNPLSTSTPGTYNFHYNAVLSGITVSAAIAVTVTKPTPATPTATLTPAANPVSIAQGNWGYADLTLKSVNGLTGVPSFTLYCIGSCPAGFNYNRPDGAYTSSLPANGSLAIRVGFYPLATSTIGTYNFQYNAVVSGVTAIATITVTVTKPSTTPTLSVTLGSSNLSPTVNNAVTLTATPSGGSGSGYSCGWNVSSSTACQISYTPTATSNQTVTVTAKDSTGKTATASLSLNVQAAAATTGTVVVNTTNNIPVSCVINNSQSITAPVTLNNQALGTKSIGCSEPYGYTIVSISPSSQSLSGGGTVTFMVNLSALPVFSVSCGYTPTTLVLTQSASVSAMQIGGALPVTYTINGVNMGTNNTQTFTPSGLGAFNSSVSAKDAKGRTASGSCGTQVVAPQPVLSSVFPDRTPKASQPFNLTVYGSGFINGSAASVCGSTAASSCYPVATNYVSSGQLLLPNVQWNVANVTVYIKVVNPGNLTSGFQTLAISK